MDLGLSALGQKNATILSPWPALGRWPPVQLVLLSAFCWCSFAGTLPPCGFPTRPRSGFCGWRHLGLRSEGREVEECSGGKDWSMSGASQNSMVVLLCEELVGWSSWFRAVTHERWVCRLVWTAPPFRAEPMCEAERTHHPAPELEELVRSDDLQFALFTYTNTLFSA